MNKPGKSQSIQNWRTPQWVFDYANSRWGPFAVDAASRADDSKCPRSVCNLTHATLLDAMRGRAGAVWLNPPFAHAADFIRTAAGACSLQQKTLVALVSANLGTQWSIDFLKYSEYFVIAPRVNYVYPDVPRDRDDSVIEDPRCPTSAGAAGNSMFIVMHQSARAGRISILDLRKESRGKK